MVLGWPDSWSKYPGALWLRWLLKIPFRWERRGMYCELAVLLGLPLSDETRELWWKRWWPCRVRDARLLDREARGL